MDRTYAPDWTEAEREQWIEDYRAERPVLLPDLEHEPGECDHCDLLSGLMQEADRRDDEAGALERRTPRPGQPGRGARPT